MKLAICSRSVSNNKYALKILKKKFNKITVNKSNKIFKDNELLNFVKNSNAIIVGLEKIDKKFLDNCPNLKYIGKYGVGTNNIEFDQLKKKKIKIFLQKGINKRSVSELTLSFMILALRKIIQTINFVKNGDWPFFAGAELSGNKIGIIGIGNIGRDLIKLLKPFNCKIYCNDIDPNKKFFEKNNLKNSNIKTVLSKSNIVTIHIPYNEKNKNLISKKEFSYLKKKVILINTSRGGIVDELELYNFLKKNPSSIAIFDVLKSEPPVNNKLLNLSNFFVTSHIAGTTKESLDKGSIDCATKLVNGIK